MQAFICANSWIKKKMKYEEIILDFKCIKIIQLLHNSKNNVMYVLFLMSGYNLLPLQCSVQCCVVLCETPQGQTWSKLCGDEGSRRLFFLGGDEGDSRHFLGGAWKMSLLDPAACYANAPQVMLDLNPCAADGMYFSIAVVIFRHFDITDGWAWRTQRC